MEAVIEKECSALGGLFQTIISDMKVGRRGRGCSDLAAGLPLRRGRPGPLSCAAVAGHLRELWPPGCHLLTRRAAPAVLGHWAGDFPGRGGGVVGKCHLPTPAFVIPGGDTILFLWGLRALVASFPLSVPGLSVCDPWRLDARADT